MVFDAKTLLIATLISNLSMLLLVTIMTVFRRSQSSLAFSLAYFCSALGFAVNLIYADQQNLGPTLLVTWLIFAFYVLLLAGLRSFFGLASFPAINRILSVAFLGLSSWFTFVYPSFLDRTQVFTVFALLLFILNAVPINRVLTLQRPYRILVMLLFIEQIAVFSVRLLVAVFQPENYSGLSSNNLISVFTLLTAIFNLGIWAAGILAIQFNQITERLNSQQQELEKLAVIDQLTGLYNRNVLDSSLDEFISHAQRSGEPLSMILMDLDHFKRINDRYGHTAGDQVLIVLADQVRKHSRAGDRIIRWGGEEILILLPQTDLQGAAKTAERIRLTLMQHVFSFNEPITISMGVSTYQENEPPEIWFKRTDVCLYRAKQLGRNQVVTWKADDQLPLAMLRIDWQKSWESGDRVIDQEHQELLEICNRLIDDAVLSVERATQEKNYRTLLEKLSEHFSHEEAILADKKYKDLSVHQQQHRELLSQMGELLIDLNHDKVDLESVFNLVMGKFIVGHILSSDVSFFRRIRA